MTTQLALYNGALRLLKERKLSSLSENREPRRVLDDEWLGAVSFCLEQGLWKFAKRTSKITYNPDYTRQFGYHYQFIQPDDFIRLASMTSDEYQNVPLNQYTDEAGSWYADLQEIFVSYTSNSAEYGNDLSKWPETFCRYVELYLAVQVGPRITGEDDKLQKRMEKALIMAKSKDAMKDPTKFLPQGNWTLSRTQGVYNRRDGGNRGTLLG